MVVNGDGEFPRSTAASDPPVCCLGMYTAHDDGTMWSGSAEGFEPRADQRDKLVRVSQSAVGKIFSAPPLHIQLPV